MTYGTTTGQNKRRTGGAPPALRPAPPSWIGLALARHPARVPLVIMPCGMFYRATWHTLRARARPQRVRTEEKPGYGYRIPFHLSVCLCASEELEFLLLRTRCGRRPPARRLIHSA